jgi:hypothetical protein
LRVRHGAESTSALSILANEDKPITASVEAVKAANAAEVVQTLANTGRIALNVLDRVMVMRISF